MTIENLYDEEEQARIRAEIEGIRREYHNRGTHVKGRRYFVRLAEKYHLVEKLEDELDRYQKEELDEKGPTSDVEIADFFSVRNFSVQNFLNIRMDAGKRNIKAEACLEIGRGNGWPHLRDSGKIPPLEGRVRDAAIKAIKKKWEEYQKNGQKQEK